MRARDWWRSREPRERQVLVVGALVAGLLLGYALVWKPVADFHRELVAQVQRQRQDLAWMQHAGAVLTRLRGAQPDRTALEASPMIAVQEAASSVGIKAGLRRLETDADGGLRVRLEGVRLEAALAWLQTLERRYAIGVQRLVLEPGAAPGLATLNVRLLTPARIDGAKGAGAIAGGQRRRSM